MQFKKEASVYTSDGKDIGRVERVVLNPRTKEVTHIIVQKGFLFTEDKVIPLDMIASANSDRVELLFEEKQLENLPPFEETHYTPLTDEESLGAAYPGDMALPLYWYPPSAGWTGYAAVPPPYKAETEQNIPEDTVAVKEGASVISSDGKHVGNIEELFADTVSGRVTAFIVSQGLLLKERKSIPMMWVHNVIEDEVHLTVSSTMIENLREYEGA